MRKGQTAMEYLMTYGWAILVVMMVLAVLFYLGVLNPATISPNQCAFPAGFTCVTNQLRTNGSLFLRIGQATGKTIRVCGVACTQNSNLLLLVVTPPPGGPVSYGAGGCIDNVTIPSGSQAVVATPGGGFLAINCTDANGETLAGIAGDVYKGMVYVNYTETDTGLVKVIAVKYIAKYEP